MGESANGRCSVKKVFFFATSPCSGHWLTCSAPKGYSHRRRLFSQIILPEIRTDGIRSPRNSAALVPQINSEPVLFAGYSIIRQSTSRYRATIGSYLLRSKRKASFSQEASKYVKGIPCYPRKICKSLPKHLIFAVHFAWVLCVCPPRLYSRTY